MTVEERQAALRSAHERGDYEAMLELALSLGPGRDLGLRALAEHHVERARVRRRAEEEASLPPTDPRRHVARGRLLLLDAPVVQALGDPPHPNLLEALDHLAEARALDPTNVDALALSIGAYAGVRHPAAAEIAARELAALAPTSANLLRAALWTRNRSAKLAFVLAAGEAGAEPAAVAEALHDLVGDAPDAVSDAAEARLCELAGQDPWAAGLWGQRLTKRGDPEAAIRVLAPFAGDEEVRWALQDLLRSLGRDDEADALE